MVIKSRVAEPGGFYRDPDHIKHPDPDTTTERKPDADPDPDLNLIIITLFLNERQIDLTLNIWLMNIKI